MPENGGVEGVFVEKGPFFHGKRPSRAPQIPHGPRAYPPPSRAWGLLKIPVGGLPKEGGGRGAGGGNLGSARGPFTVKKRPLFDENALLGVGVKNGSSICRKNSQDKFDHDK